MGRARKQEEQTGETHCHRRSDSQVVSGHPFVDLNEVGQHLGPGHQLPEPGLSIVPCVGQQPCAQGCLVHQAVDGGVPVPLQLGGKLVDPKLLPGRLGIKGALQKPGTPLEDQIKCLDKGGVKGLPRFAFLPTIVPVKL